MNCLKVLDLNKKYGKKEALKNVNITLTPGIYGLLGSNGAGKSTLLKILTLTLSKSSGEIYWNEEKIKTGLKGNCNYLRSLSYLPQNQALYPDFTAYEYLDYIASLKEIPKEKIKNEIEKVLKDVELWENAHQKIKIFSGGMKQRLMIAQSMMNTPAIILLDEPTTGLDPRQRMILKGLLVKISKETIVLLSTHIVSDIEALANQVILINHGEIIKTMAPEELVDEMYKKVGGQVSEEGFLSDLEKAYLYFCREEGLDNGGNEKN
ncbi:ABC-type multidrug transport system, ATPase component [Acetitomaculum ruminis DSM 5522]|uniref:ABC-type multidrug transport system, ATPase component n=1 Tax=Acetitomaculum ruminis DSM 5522 TaxID=1120918 RepID=A0A1I0YZD8_9FIRM|nr:ATP-binding cassette domain-containing protein [Acetitomaculum ruminis]SFB18724.1 ABC-type multidrug transport system, ATPase component [Acetitomaculum ruminis DSM 5522]